MSTNNKVVEKLHSELGASVASRWMNCPGSIRLSRGLPTPPSTSYAEEGTAAHALAELCLRRGVDPTTYVGTTLEGVKVTDEMAEFVGVYVKYCRALIGAPGEEDEYVTYHVEQKFTLASLTPPGPMFGTADFVAYDTINHTLFVVDLKYGQGVVVEARGNKQLRYYALGAALSMPDVPIERIVMVIVQPRATHPDGPIRSETIPFHEIVEFADELLAAAKRTTDPDAPLNAGSWCRFCPASGICPAQLKHAQEIAQVEFAAMPLDVPPDPETLPPEILADLLTKLPILEDWAAAMRAAAHRKLERGESLPGFKLVAKRATRQWKDADEAEQWLKAEGREPDEIYDHKIKSVAQIEKLVGKKNLPADLHEKRSSGYNMVPVHDPRPAVAIAPGDDFLALPSGEEE